MPFNTFSVATAVTPSVIETYFSHYLNRRPLRQKPTAHISYHEGLKLIRQFLDYSSKHTIEDLQAFTAQWVPVPTWVRTQDCEIPPQFIQRSANLLQKHLGANGIEKIGGEKWWQWRRPEHPLHAEWIEMKKDYNERKKAGVKCDRVILYIHGGAYYFGSVDEHRYQMQRHARKLKARVLAPRYRLAPQFPFPCGLHDCIATYFYLLEHFDPTQILFAGDSAGGGMVLSLLVVLRDQGCPLPAGTMLLSPWVDLTHSFPSTAGDGTGDYIPPHAFHHKPSMAWPPPPVTEAKAKKPERKFTQPVEQAFDVVELPATEDTVSIKPSRDNLRADFEKDAGKTPPAVRNRIPGLGDKLEITIDDKIVEIREQIQMYARNELLAHPLVSPVQQPSLGGLPPMLIQVGGAELLRDEQIYLAHKAAHPKDFPPSSAILDEYDPERIILNQYPPTDVKLEIWEDLCHVPHTLSFTRPAKYMFRSVAQFGAWALARAQHKSIDILDDDAVSIISEVDEQDKDMDNIQRVNTWGSIGDDGVTSTQVKLASIGAVGKAGDDLPPFKDHMIRHRINRHGIIFPLPHPSEIASLHLDPDSIGALKPGPVKKWLAKRADNEHKFANEYKKVLKKRTKEMKDGYDTPKEGEEPPPTAIVNRLRKGVAPEQKKKGKSWGLAMWSGWGSSHDESTIQREEKVLNDKAEEESKTEEASNADLTRSGSIAATVANTNGAAPSGVAGSSKNLAVPGQEDEADGKSQRRLSGASMLSARGKKEKDEARPRSPYRQVRDAGQASTERDSSAVSPVVSPISPIGGNGEGGESSPKQRPSSRGWGWDLSRRSSGASGKRSFNNRPVSVGVATQSSPLSSGQLDGIPKSPTLLASAPSMSDTGKEVVKVPGTEATYLNPESSRPHNGFVAYPFKLQQPAFSRHSPNPSTMTLDSNNGYASDGDSAVAYSALVGSMVNPDVYARANGGDVERPTYEMPGSIEMEATPTVAGPPPDGPTSFGGDRPVSAAGFDFTPHAGHQSAPSLDDPVSPVETPSTLPAESATSAAASSAYTQGHNKFESRDSRLGFLGADGMPVSAFPDSAPPKEEDETTADAPKAPFKIRNPVYDARVPADADPISVVETQAPQQPEAPQDAGKSAPFKMRHTIYDSKVAPPSSKDPSEPVPAVPSSSQSDASAAAAAAAAAIAAKNLAQVVDMKAATAPRSDAAHAAAAATAQSVTVANASTAPEAAQQRVSLRDFPPPPPPPKDDEYISKRNNANTRRKNSIPISKFSSAPSAPSSSAMGPTQPADSISKPLIGDLSFEREGPVDLFDVKTTKSERPGLEHFVTASEGLDLKSVGGRAL